MEDPETTREKWLEQRDDLTGEHASGDAGQAVFNLIEKLGGRVEEIAFVIELPDLKGKEKLNKWKVFSIVKFKGE